VNLIPELGENMPELSNGVAITLVKIAEQGVKNAMANADARKRSVDVYLVLSFLFFPSSLVRSRC
jgi:hypothetical protein